MKKYIIGLTMGVVLAGVPVVFANSQIQAILNNKIKVTLDGQVQEFKDELTDETQYPITYNDRTYLPLRTVANLVGMKVDYDFDSNTANLMSYDYKNNSEYEEEYFWNYQDVEKYADSLVTSVYDEIHDKFIFVEKSNVAQNTLASLIKKFGEDDGLEKFYQICDMSNYWEAYGGDQAAFIIRKTNYESIGSFPFIYLDDEPIEIEYVQEHEDLMNRIWDLIKYGKKSGFYESKLYESKLRYLDEVASDSYIKAQIQEMDNIIQEMENDIKILKIKNECETYEDLSFEDLAYLSKYSSGYFERPENANYSVGKLLIMNGYSTKKEYYYQHARAKKVRVTINGKEYILDLEDTPECQIFDINYVDYDISKPLSIKMEVLEKYEAFYNDVYFSNIEFEIEASVYNAGR